MCALSTPIQNLVLKLQVTCLFEVFREFQFFVVCYLYDKVAFLLPQNYTYFVLYTDVIFMLQRFSSIIIYHFDGYFYLIIYGGKETYKLNTYNNLSYKFQIKYYSY